MRGVHQFELVDPLIESLAGPGLKIKQSSQNKEPVTKTDAAEFINESALYSSAKATS